MELTPQLFRDVQFTERRGAYDKDEVHAFLARVGTAVGQMQERVREAQRRLEAAEDHIAKLEAAAREQQDADETLRRTLVLAQRTADAAIKEAQDEAEVIVAEARSKADDMIVQAEEAVRRDVGATRDKLQAEIRDLERHRDELRRRVALIADHLESERSRIHAELGALSTVLDDPERLVVAPVPGSDPEPVIVLSESTPAQYDDTPEPDAPADDPPMDEPVDSADDLSHLPPPPVGWRPDESTASPDDPETSPDDPGPSGGLFEPVSDEPRGRRDDDGGPPTEAHPIINAGTSFGGSHLDELRRAVSDDATDAEGDAAMAAFFDQDTDDEPSRRFGRRR